MSAKTWDPRISDLAELFIEGAALNVSRGVREQAIASLSAVLQSTLDQWFEDQAHDEHDRDAARHED